MGQKRLAASRQLEAEFNNEFLRDVLKGLSKPEKRLPSKYFYDERGSRLFDDICSLEEYYPTRTEIRIMETHGDDICERLGPGLLLIEFGSGSSVKSRILLDGLDDLAGYVPVDISEDHLLATSGSLEKTYPELAIMPVVADFNTDFEIPKVRGRLVKKVVYFPGSTIGNFEHAKAIELLKRIADICGRGGGLLIGVDLQKDSRVLEAAYNDCRGITRDFNLNMLMRMNEELDADFDLGSFDHSAVYNSEQGRIEMRLIAKKSHQVMVAGRPIPFLENEAILTEYSHKYSPEGFARLALKAGFAVDTVWTDPQNLFSVQYLTRHD